MEALQVAVLIFDASSRVVGSNSSARTLMGLVEGGEAPALLHEDGSALPATEHPAAQVLARGAPVRGAPLAFRRPSGELVYVVVDAGPRVDSDGETAEVVVSLVDVSAHRAAQLSVKDGETRYRTLFESMDAAVLVMRGAECIACNPATLKLFGLTRAEDFLGKTPLDFAPVRQPDGTASAELVQRNIALAVVHGSQTFEWQSLRASGEPFTMEVRFTPFAVGGESLFQCIALDISERKRAEEALRQSEAQFRAIIERAADGVLVADIEQRRFRYANPAICRMLGYTADEMLALGVEGIHPKESVPAVVAEFERQRSGEQLDADVPVLRKDGTVFDAQIRSVRVALDGRASLVGFFRDLTTEHQLEEQRLRAERLEAIGVLAGGIAHDFNNLLQGVFGFLSIAREQYADRARCLTALQKADEALNLAVGLTSQLLTFSRGGAPVKRIIDVRLVVASATRFALSGSRLDCRLDLAADLPGVDADEGQLAQVVQNIVLNADQATPMGGVLRVAVRVAQTGEPGVPLQLEPGTYVAIEVKDAGVGIAPPYLARIFDPYFTTKERGSGLGLATSYSIVKRHGGVIDVRSELGRGSTFTVYLPASHAKPSVAVVAEERQAAGRSARILVMDDEALLRESVSSLLNALGHEVDLAEDGASAVAKYGEARTVGRPFDVVILDLTVRGGVGGVQAIKDLLRVDPDVKAIVSSGYSDEPAIAEFREYGFSAVLPKPYTMRELERVVGSVLG
ncbi:MAG: PAS domain S-box protein [Deltaproteobacteria bacterium]